MDDHRVLVRRLGEDLHRHLLERRIEAGVGALRREAGELRDAVRAADRLEVLVEHLVGDDPRVGREIARVRIFNRRAVLQREARIASRALVAAGGR